MEEDYICCNGSKAAAIAALSFLSILSLLFTLSFSHVLFSTLSSTLSFCSHKYASFIGKYGQHWWDKEALKHATICGINGATTCLVVGYCHQMAIS
jgi:hypothetical protein